MSTMIFLRDFMASLRGTQMTDTQVFKKQKQETTKRTNETSRCPQNPQTVGKASHLYLPLQALTKFHHTLLVRKPLAFHPSTYLGAEIMQETSAFLIPSRKRWLRELLSCLHVASMLALSGCAAMQLKLGTKTDLTKLPVTTISASLPKGPAIAPGEKAPLVVSFTTPDGKVLFTEGQGQGKILWRDVKIAATVVSVNNKGILSLPEDPRVSDGKVPHVTITVPSHPDLKAELDIPVRYDQSYNVSFHGSPGSSGFNGTDGLDGSNGSYGSLDPDHPSPGGNGGDGTNGTDGTNGGRGGDGPPVDVRVTLRPGVVPLLEVSVSAQGKGKLFMIDPQGGSLTVRSEGGPGGSGGKGGRGGRGGSGGIGSPNGLSGHDGLSGNDGADGSAGRGGSIAVTYDPQVRPYLDVIRLSNPGGPRPVYKDEPVAALW